MMSTPINLRQVQHFVVLAKHQSYVRAAEELGLTQSALTRSIQALEQTLSVRLLDRDRAGVRLTASGREIIAQAEGLLARADELMRKITVSNSGVIGRVSIGLVPHAALIFPARIIPGLMKDYPQLNICVEVLNVDPLLDLLAAGEIEILVCSDRVVPPDAPVDLAPLMDVQVSGLVRRGHPLEGQSNITREDLERYPSVSGRWSHYFAKEGVLRPADPTVSCNDFRTLIAITAESDAVWISPSTAWLSDSEKTGLVELAFKPGEFIDSVRLYLVTARRRTLSSQARLLSERIMLFSERASQHPLLPA